MLIITSFQLLIVNYLFILFKVRVWDSILLVSESLCYVLPFLSSSTAHDICQEFAPIKLEKVMKYLGLTVGVTVAITI